jgi:hypothetical protein
MSSRYQQQFFKQTQQRQRQAQQWWQLQQVYLEKLPKSKPFFTQEENANQSDKNKD